MKLAALALALLSATAHAETIPFEPTYCSSTRVCRDVEQTLPDTPYPSVHLYAAPTSGSVTVIVGDAIYTSAPGTNNPGLVLQGIVATNDAGESLTLDATFEHHVTQVNSGRAHYQIQKWTLVAGQVVR